jgi:hypothetical protein
VTHATEQDVMHAYLADARSRGERISGTKALLAYSLAHGTPYIDERGTAWAPHEAMRAARLTPDEAEQVERLAEELRATAAARRGREHVDTDG